MLSPGAVSPALLTSQALLPAETERVLADATAITNAKGRNRVAGDSCLAAGWTVYLPCRGDYSTCMRSETQTGRTCMKRPLSVRGAIFTPSEGFSGVEEVLGGIESGIGRGAVRGE